MYILICQYLHCEIYNFKKKDTDALSVPFFLFFQQFYTLFNPGYRTLFTHDS